MENLILVDSQDKEIGTDEKINCHIGKGKLHRALSIYIFNKNNELLLQKRSRGKMLWPLYWTNTCCTHPREGETIREAANRRIKEEMGFDCNLEEFFVLEYHAQYRDVGSENEIDHVLLGRYDGPVLANPKEVEEWKFAKIEELKCDIKKNPQNYTPRFKISLDEVIENLYKI